MPDQAAFLGLLFHQERTTMGYGCGAQQLRWDGKQLVGEPLLRPVARADGANFITYPYALDVGARVASPFPP
jgi:hypothetical protein